MTIFNAINDVMLKYHVRIEDIMVVKDGKPLPVDEFFMTNAECGNSDIIRNCTVIDSPVRKIKTAQLFCYMKGMK